MACGKNDIIDLYVARGDDELVEAVTGHSSIEMLKRMEESKAKSISSTGTRGAAPHGTE